MSAPARPPPPGGAARPPPPGGATPAKKAPPGGARAPPPGASPAGARAPPPGSSPAGSRAPPPGSQPANAQNDSTSAGNAKSPAPAGRVTPAQRPVGRTPQQSASVPPQESTSPPPPPQQQQQQQQQNEADTTQAAPARATPTQREPTPQQRSSTPQQQQQQSGAQSAPPPAQGKSVPPPPAKQQQPAGAAPVLAPARRTVVQSSPAQSPEFPFRDDNHVSLTMELTGVNYSQYEEMKELDPARRQQFDAEMHAIALTALVPAGLHPPDVWVAVNPGVVVSLMLQYARGTQPTMLDAEWTVRVFIAARCTASQEQDVLSILARELPARQPFIDGVWKRFFTCVDRVGVEVSSSDRVLALAKEIAKKNANSGGDRAADPKPARDVEATPRSKARRDDGAIEREERTVERSAGASRRIERIDDIETVDEYTDTDGNLVVVRERVSRGATGSRRSNTRRREEHNDRDEESSFVSDDRGREVSRRGRVTRDTDRSYRGGRGGLYGDEGDSDYSDYSYAEQRNVRGRGRRESPRRGLNRSDVSDFSEDEYRHRNAGTTRRTSPRRRRDDDYDDSVTDFDDRGGYERSSRSGGRYTDDYVVKVHERRRW